ncbi:hypothetical protein GCM10010401_18060 [Rarobacter faecitabidus]|uniref:S-ribosylhomocysteine lyase n=2 Tax=Rarobacter faecitabidus TaxID=13243 RepID=A0A542ZUT0_RARFA|nr:S-ribosylhomocysteine lyase /quorum-sensing autoinducer 2 (AI-2) synthesis protein LuxS [Rarobacter faecitabidus]
MNVESFNLDHRFVTPPYIRVADRKELPHGDALTKFDVRFTQPNSAHLEMPAVHSLEHLFAEHSRNHSDRVVDFSPMGCQTGFYLLLSGHWEAAAAADLVAATLQDILHASEVPAANEIQCGWGANHSLAGAQAAAAEFLAGREGWLDFTTEPAIEDDSSVARRKADLRGDRTADAIVVVAMEEEEAPFIAAGEIVGEPVRVGNASLTWLAIEDKSVVVVRSGISFVNAASGLVAAIDALTAAGAKLPYVISAGTAGGLGADVRVGDVIVGTAYIHSQVDARAFGYALGQVPRMPASYEGDPGLVSTARQVAHDAPLRTGLILAGDSFASPELAASLLTEWPEALCIDMESSALAQVAHNYGLAFASIRGISDLCGPDEFHTHVDDAANRSAAVVLDLIARS